MSKTNKIWLIGIILVVSLGIIFTTIKFSVNSKSISQDKAEQITSWTWASIEQAESEIMSMVDNNRYNEAERAISQLLSDFSHDLQLPKSLYWIAERYRWSETPEEAVNLYNKIIREYPQSEYMRKAEINIAREQITSLIKKEDYTGAQGAVDRFVLNYTSHPDSPETLYWIADKYHWSDKTEEAKSLYDKIIRLYPNSPFSNRAKLSLAREKVVSLVLSHDFVSAKEEIDKLMHNFSSEPEFPEALCRIADHYHWGEQYEQAKNLFEIIIRDYPHSASLDRAKLCLAREEITLLIDLGNYVRAQKAIDEMIINFAQDPNLPETLYWIAEKYGWMGEKSQWMGVHDEAKKLYKRIVRDYPNSSYSGKAKLNFAREEVMALFASDNNAGAQKAFDKMLTSFADNPNLEKSIYEIGIVCYTKAKMMFDDGNTEAAKTYYRNAAEIWERLIREFPDTTLLPSSYFFTGSCYIIGLGEYRKAIDCFQEVVDNWPNCEFAEYAQYLIGECYKKLMDSGVLQKRESFPKMEESYKKVIENCTATELLGSALIRLGQINLEQGEFSKATQQEDLAKKIFVCWKNLGDNNGLIASEYFLHPFLDNEPKFDKTLDLIEEKWLYFPTDDYYDEIGIFLLWGNIVAGRFDKTEDLFTKMNENLVGKSIDPLLNDNLVIEVIDRINFCKELFSTREDLSLLYASKMLMEMYAYQGKRDKYFQVFNLIRDNYKGTKGVDFLDNLYKYRAAELKYGSLKSIPAEEVEKLKENYATVKGEMNKTCGDSR